MSLPAPTAAPFSTHLPPLRSAMQHPTLTNVRIRSTRDALQIFYAVARNILPMTTRRLDAEERRASVPLPSMYFATRAHLSCFYLVSPLDASTSGRSAVQTPRPLAWAWNDGTLSTPCLWREPCSSFALLQDRRHGLGTKPSPRRESDASHV